MRAKLSRHKWGTRVENDYAEKRGRGMSPFSIIKVAAYTALGRFQYIIRYLHGYFTASACHSFAENLN